VENSINITATHIIENLQNHPALYDSRLTQVVNQIIDWLRVSRHALQAAQHNPLSIDYLSPNLFKGLFRKLESWPFDFHYNLLIKLLSDLYQLETSLLYNKIFAHLLLHTPMIPKQSFLQLLGLHQFPATNLWKSFQDSKLEEAIQHEGQITCPAQVGQGSIYYVYFKA
jgi:hypothetical protein